MHKLLQRQIRKSLGKDFDLNSCDEKFKKLFENISEMYDHNDSQRKSLEHIISVNTEELKEANENINLLLEQQKKENISVSNILKQYKKAMDEALIINITDLNGNFKFVNDKFCELTQFKEEELKNQHYTILKSSSHNETKNNFKDEITKNKIWKGVIKGFKKDGSNYFVKSIILPFYDENGEVLEYMSLNDDVTNMIYYQNELQAQKERINTIFNSEENITVIVKPGVGIVDANAKFYENFNFKNLTEYKNIYKCFSELFIETKNLLDTKIEIGEKWFVNFLEEIKEFDNKLTYKDNQKELIFKIFSKKIILEKQEHYITSLVDITELENARKKAEIAEQAKTTFLANMSHEIRTPLNSIIGFANILCEEDLNAKSLKHSKIISKSATSLLEIINDVLDISKIESGKLEIIKDSFSLKDFIHNIIDLFSIRASQNNVNFEYIFNDDLPSHILSDETRLRQVIFNLLSNAIKFTKANETVSFEISLLSKSENTAKIKFKVSDTGIGISQENIEKIFKPFSQADDRISRDYGGTGLGLTICSDIVKLMNSRIIVESKLGEGSCFYFDIDVEIDNNKFLDQNSQIKQKIDTQENKALHILVAEDNANNILLIEILLEKLNSTFTISKNGQEAYEAYQNENFDLVLMDVNMPIMDGMKASKLIKEYEAKNNLSKTPIVALTANSIVGDKERYLANGMDDYLSKPINFDDLESMLKKYGSKN